MEGNLLKILWEKLLEALRINPAPPITSATIQPEEPFTVDSQGIKIVGQIFFPATGPKLYPSLIICHGIPGSGTARPANDPGYEKLCKQFASAGIAAVFFNFRGCGPSGGDFDMVGWARDLERVLDKVYDTPHIDPTRIMVLGFSGGGAAAIRVAAETNRIFSLAVVGTPAGFEIFDDSPEKIVDEFKERGIIRNPNFPYNIEKWIDDFKEVEPRRWISQFQGKHLLIMHGDADELVPVEHAQELYELAPAGIAELIIIPGGVHRLRLDQRCFQQLKRWFYKTLGWLTD